MTHLYLPLLYSERVKHPGQHHFLKRIVSGHWLFSVIVWSLPSPHPVLNAISLLLLVLSYWCVYEVGYQENDTVGEKYEKNPNLSANYEQYKSQINLHTPWPWVWAIALAVPGCTLFTLSELDGSVTLTAGKLGGATTASLCTSVAQCGLVWVLYLIAIRTTFWVYNQFSEETRIWIYPFLQIQRRFAFALLAPMSLVGVILMMSFVISRWIQYTIYRCGGDRKSFPVNVSCLLLFVLLFAAIALSLEDSTQLINQQALVALVYCACRSVRKISQLGATVSLVATEHKTPA